MTPALPHEKSECLSRYPDHSIPRQHPGGPRTKPRLDVEDGVRPTVPDPRFTTEGAPDQSAGGLEDEPQPDKLLQFVSMCRPLQPSRPPAPAAREPAVCAGPPVADLRSQHPSPISCLSTSA